MFVVWFAMYNKREQQSVAVEVPMASSIEDEVEKHPRREILIHILMFFMSTSHYPICPTYSSSTDPKTS